MVVDRITVVATLLLALLSMQKKGYKLPINRLFAAVSITLALWILLGDTLNDSSIPADFVLNSAPIAYFCGYSVEVLLVYFICKLGSDKSLSRFINRVTPILWVLGLIAFTPYVITGVEPLGSIYAAKFGPLIWMYLVLVLINAAIMTYALVRGLINNRGLVRQQLVAISIAMLIALPAELSFSLIFQMAGVYSFDEYAFLPMIFLTVSLYYSVIRYHLFDIRLAAVRTLAYTLSLGLLVGIYYGLAVLISGLLTASSSLISQNPINIILIFSLLFIFQPIKRFFDKLTNRIFYRDYYDSDAFLDRLNRILTSTTNLRHLLQQVAFEIATTLKSEQAFFYITTHDGHHLTAGTPGHCQLTKDYIIALRSTNNHPEVTIEHKDNIILSSMLDENDPLRQLMTEDKIEVVLPLAHHGLVGYLFLGDHLTSHYTSRDIKVLSMIDDSLVIAIQNALSVESIRESNTELRQIDRIKDDFVSIASHELRTPMTVIRGYVSLLQRQQLGPQNDKQQSILNKISDNTKVLINLVNDMLDLSKLEANKLELNLGIYPIDGLIQKSINQVELMYAAKGLRLTYLPTRQNNDVGAGILVNVDPTHFDRIMINLLSNAYKFTDKGSVTIKATLVKSDSKTSNKTDMVVVTITDTGIGISEDAMPTLFKKFSQVENYLQRSTGGTGLGLAICQHLIARLDGKIGVNSVENKGSEFWFEVPRG
jgi:signal transduction histidine kinase